MPPQDQTSSNLAAGQLPERPKSRPGWLRRILGRIFYTRRQYTYGHKHQVTQNVKESRTPKQRVQAVSPQDIRSQYLQICDDPPFQTMLAEAKPRPRSMPTITRPISALSHNPYTTTPSNSSAAQVYNQSGISWRPLGSNPPAYFHQSKSPAVGLGPLGLIDVDADNYDSDSDSYYSDDTRCDYWT